MALCGRHPRAKKMTEEREVKVRVHLRCEACGRVEETSEEQALELAKEKI